MNQAAPKKWQTLPEDYFFIPGQDDGLAFQEEPDWFLRRVPGARVRQYACSEFPRIQKVIQKNIESRWTDIEPVIFEVNTVPMVAKNVVFRNGVAELSGKCLLNGAAGDRVLARYFKHNESGVAFRRTNRFFFAAQEKARLDLPVDPADPSRAPLGIECRNRTNYYHFMTETLPQLTYADPDASSDIVIHCRNDDPSGFSDRFIRTFFPELVDRISFTSRRASYDRAIIPFNFRHCIYSNGDPRLTLPLSDTGKDDGWQRLGAHIKRRKFVFKNSFDISLRRMRERALSMIRPEDLARMPRRIWVSRDNSSDVVQKKRLMVGEDRLIARLRELGFVQMFFEHMSPYEQIAAVHAADVIGSVHGAFFANMMFARPDAHVIEVGSVQTQLHRWGDFLGNAHASGCRYSKVFADIATPDPTRVPLITEGHVGVKVGDAAIDLICGLAEDGQDARGRPSSGSGQVV